MSIMGLSKGLLLLTSVIQPALAAFGISTAGNDLKVDTGGGLVFEVNKCVDSRYNVDCR